MASIHIKEIMQFLSKKGAKDALPYDYSREGFFLEIKFDEEHIGHSVKIDEKYKNKVITADCPYGCVTIIFDSKGQLKSLDIS